MKVTVVRINKTEKDKLPDFIKEVNNEEDSSHAEGGVL